MTTSPSASSGLRMLPAFVNGSEKQRSASSAFSAANSASSTSGAQNGDFYKQLISVLALGMMSGGSGSSDLSGMSSGSQSSGMGNFMAPMMLMLLEKLLSGDVEQSATPQSAGIKTGGIGAAQSSGAGSEITGGGSTPSGLPVHGPLTQGSHPGHVALDLGVPVGTAVKTTMTGKVVYAGWNNEGYGNLVIVENGPYKTYYGHFSKVEVKVGDTVQAGEVVGKSGNTGNSTGPHLHYEVRVNNQQVNPAKYS